MRPSQAQQKEARWFEQSVKKCACKARTIVQRYSISDANSEDVIQEAIARAWRFRGACRTAFAPWFFQIVRNQAVDFSGRRYKTAEVVTDPHDPVMGANVAPVDVFSQVAHSEQVRGLLRVAEQRGHLEMVLMWLNGYSDAQIADRLGVTERAVRLRKFRFKAVCRKELS